MKIWLISDTHFNHTKLEEWGGRSGNWQEQMLAGLKAIPSGDTLLHLGDICIGNDSEVHKLIFDALTRDHGRGDERESDIKTVLVRGNHDKASVTKYYDWGWGLVCDGLDLTISGYAVHLSHRPQRERSNIVFNIHGHTHGNMHRSEEYLDFYQKGYHIDISPELVGYKPVSLTALIEKAAHKRTT